MSEPQKRSALRFRRRYSPVPTRESNEQPPFHHAARRRGGGVAARGARAETGGGGGWISATGSPADSSHYATTFLQGLRETGYVEGQSVAIEYRWAEGRYERLSQF